VCGVNAQVFGGPYLSQSVNQSSTQCVCVVNAQVFEDEASMNKLEDVKLGDFGRVAEVTITKDDCLLMKVRQQPHLNYAAQQ